MIDKNFWHGKKILVTGHTGFKGSWLCSWLNLLGAEVYGVALKPTIQPSMFQLCKVDHFLKRSTISDVRDCEKLMQAVKQAEPDIIIHMAAQSLVHESYKRPVDTYAVNVMGTVHLLEAVRNCKSVKAVINVTTDKCYDNKEWVWGYRENEPMGGYDPYSISKACSEIVTSAYRNSFFNYGEYEKHGVAVATARAGNVIGGGDWSPDRLIPDCISALLRNERIQIRNPHAIRPWQHVLEPLSGYLLLAQKLYTEGVIYAEGWNFGPNDSDAKPVSWVVEEMCNLWGGSAGYDIDTTSRYHEASYLKLDCSKAKAKLGWYPRWELAHSLKKIIEWIQAYQQNKNMLEITLMQIHEYMSSKGNEE